MSSDQRAVRLLIVPGSLRAASYSAQLARQAGELAPAGVAATVFDGLKEVAPFNEDDELNAPAGVVAWRRALREADVVLFVTPEYNSSIPGQLKNAIDWASRADDRNGGPLSENALYGRHTGVISSSTGQYGGVWAAAEVIRVLKALGARVVENEQFSLGSAAEAFDDSGALISDSRREKLTAFVADLVETVRAFAA